MTAFLEQLQLSSEHLDRGTIVLAYTVGITVGVAVAVFFLATIV
jgi:hypothetical protein